MAIQVDGKIVAAGYTEDQVDRNIALIRLNTDGTLDNTFSFDGKVVTSVGSSGNQALCSGVVIGPNGSITVAGRSKELSSDAEAVLIRYQSDGSLDNGFGVNGVVKKDFGAGSDAFHDLAIDGSGKIVACGSSGNLSNENMLIARFNTDGSIDNTFSFDGFVQTDFFGASDGANSIVIQPDSKILVGGATSNGTSIFALARYNTDGTLDNTFGTNGKVSTEIGTTSSIQSITLQSDLAIVACGFANDGGLNTVLARYTSGMNVGIGEVDAYIGSTLVYPNPITNNQVTVEYELKTDETVSIELFDLSGKMIMQLQPSAHQVAGSYQKTLTFPNVSVGNYLLKLNTKRGTVSVKIQVN